MVVVAETRRLAYASRLLSRIAVFEPKQTGSRLLACLINMVRDLQLLHLLVCALLSHCWCWQNRSLVYSRTIVLCVRNWTLSETVKWYGACLCLYVIFVVELEAVETQGLWFLKFLAAFSGASRAISSCHARGEGIRSRHIS